MADKAAYFVLTLPLRPEPWQAEKLNKCFAVNRNIYNALLNGGCKRYMQMAQTRKYRSLLTQLDATQDEKARKAIYRKLDGMVEEYRLRRYDFSKDSTQYRKYFEKNTDAPIAQNLAVNAWKAVQAMMKQRTGRVHTKSCEALTSLAGKTNKTSIRYKDGCMLWKDLVIPVRLKSNWYETEALRQEIRYCRVKWRWIRGRKRYFVDLILKGTCPVKQSILVMSQTGAVGIDLGMTRITCVSAQEILSEMLPARSDVLEKEKKYLVRKMERSRRMGNPGNYDARGRAAPGFSFWKQSVNYRKNKQKYREILRKQTAIRNEKQNLLLRQILQMGDCFFVEKLDYAKMKQRHFGKKVEQLALSAFLKKMEWKCSQSGRRIVYVNPAQAVAGSLNHATGQSEKHIYKKKHRSIDGYLVDRHVYSAFLLQHVDEATGKVQLEKCQTDYKSFVDLYRSNTLYAENEKVS